jgi:hypothetical protein
VGAVDEHDDCKSDDAGCREDRCVDSGGYTLEPLHERVRIRRSGPDLEVAPFELREDAIESSGEFEAELDRVEGGVAYTAELLFGLLEDHLLDHRPQVVGEARLRIDCLQQAFAHRQGFEEEDKVAGEPQAVAAHEFKEFTECVSDLQFAE